MKDESKNIMEIALVDCSGTYIDSADFAYLNLRFPRLERLLDTMIDREEDFRLLSHSLEDLDEVKIQKLDSRGNFWRVWQEKEFRGQVQPNPSIRFFYHPLENVIRPVDYSDPFVQLEGNRKTPQILIASFLTHWLSSLLVMAENSEAMEDINELSGLKSEYL